MVAKEIENIENAQGVKKSDIFGIDVDYTQYTVRGHYTRAEELKKYFKTMMWLGQSGFQMTTINSDKETFKYEFVSDERLTDEKWHNMIGLRKSDDNYGDYTYEEPEIKLLDVMPWMKSYVSDENANIEIEEPEIEWEPYEE